MSDPRHEGTVVWDARHVQHEAACAVRNFFAPVTALANAIRGGSHKRAQAAGRQAQSSRHGASPAE